MKKYIFVIIIVVLVAFVWIKNYLRDQQISKNPRYSAGVFYDISSAVDGGPTGRYRFRFLNEWFKSDIVLEDQNVVKMGKYYLVKFSADKPNYSKIYISKEVSEELLRQMPDSGWIKSPFPEE